MPFAGSVELDPRNDRGVLLVRGLQLRRSGLRIRRQVLDRLATPGARVAAVLTVVVLFGGGLAAVGRFGFSAGAAPRVYNLFPTSATPDVAAADVSRSISVGVDFSPLVNGSATG